jgi:hypothetical protein
MIVLINGQKITTPKVVIMPDMFETNVDISDESGVFYSAKCGKSMVITVQEQLTSWGDMSSIPKET